MTSHRLSLTAAMFAGVLLGMARAAAMPPPATADNMPLTVDGASPIRMVQASPQPSASPSLGQPAAQPNAADEPIGNVVSLTGVATVIRDQTSIALKLKDDIYLNDTVQTAASSSLGITFNDATTFRLSANAKIVIDAYVYEDGGSKNTGLFDIAKGTVAFAAASVAKTGTMQITTPTTTLGIRGTTGLVEVPAAGAAANDNVNVKLYPDADGRVGRIELNDRQGARLGTLTQGASGFAVRPGTGGARLAATPIAISPQQQQRDQGFVRQVHTTQTAGRQIVTEQRAFRRANPGLNPRIPARPGNQPQSPNRPGQPGTNRPGQTPPGQPNERRGQQQPQPATPGQPARAGQTTPPGTTPAQPGTTPRTGQSPTPANPTPGGAAPRTGQTNRPAAPANPAVAPATPPAATQPPPLPNGQPLLRQGGRQPGGAGAIRPRPAPAPKGKKRR